MATYQPNGSDQHNFNSLDGTTVQGEQHGKKTTSAPSFGGVGKACAVIYFVLLTAVAIVAFILGCYATDRVRSFRTPDAVLVSDPQALPGPEWSVYALGTGLGYWSPTTNMMHPRSDHGVISYRKWAYLVGGLSIVGNQANVTSSVVQYDTETGQMYEMRPLPEPRYRFAYAQLNGKIYVMGGTGVADGGPTNQVFVYDIAANSWTTSATGQLNTPRIDACGAAVNGKVYVFGGYDENFHSLSTVEVLDPASATGSAAPVWTQLPASANLMDSRGDCRAVSIDGLIYAVGGTQWFNNTQKSCENDDWVNCYRFLNTVEAFNPATNTWSRRANMISPRGDFGIEALPGGRIIVAGGERGNGSQNAMAMYDVEEYIVQHNVWVQKAPLPQARFRDDLAYVSGRVYAFGGTPSCGLIQDAPCDKLVLDTVYAYFDVQYPRLYAFYKAAAVNGTSAAS